MKTRKTNQEYRLLSQEKILSSARRLFVRKGYSNSSVDEIAAESGLTKGAVYYYSKNKEQLLLDLLAEIQLESVDQTITRVSVAETATERLVRFVNTHAEWAKRAPDELMLLILMSIEFANTKSAVRARIDEIYSQMIATLENIIDFGKRRGEFDSHLSTKDIAVVFIAAHDGNMLQWYRGGRDAKLGFALTRGLRTAFLRIVGIEPPRTEPAQLIDHTTSLLPKTPRRTARSQRLAG